MLAELFGVPLLTLQQDDKMDREQALEKHGKIFDAGTVLFYEGDPGTKLWVINEGSVRLTKRVCSEEIVIELLGPGEFCGELALIGDGIQPVTATVEETARMLVVEANQFETMLRNNGELCMRMMRKLVGRLSEAQFRLAAMQMRNTLGRVMLQLRHEVDDVQTDGNAVIPSDMAEMLSIDQVELDVAIDRLVAKNLITYSEDDKSFSIVDRDEFSRFLSYLELHDRYEFFEKM